MNNCPDHLDGYNWFIAGRYDINNGVSTCEQCHYNFHSRFGFGDNTKEQFQKFYDERIV